MCKAVEDYYGEPMDIEWVIGSREAYLVQARPITSLFPLAEPHEPPTRASKVAAGRVYWDLTPLLRNAKFWPRIGGNLAKKDPIGGKVIVAFLEKNKKEITSKKFKMKLPLRSLYFGIKFH